MEETKVHKKVEEIFRREFSNVPKLNEDISSKDIADWDSLRHVMLITEIEKEFGISFDLEDMLSMSTFGEICLNVSKKIQ